MLTELSAHRRLKLTAKVLSQALKPACSNMSMFNAFKTRYRPFICPIGLILAHIPEGARLYDIGCGTGSLLFLALKFRFVQLAQGYDIALGSVKAAAAFGCNSPNFRVDYIKPENTPPDLSGYDTVTMIDVLHHLPLDQQETFIQDAVASMDSGAKLIIKDIEASKILGAWMNQLHDLLLVREWVHPRRSQDIVRLLESTGAEVSHLIFCWSFWYPHFLVIAYAP